MITKFYHDLKSLTIEDCINLTLMWMIIIVVCFGITLMFLGYQ